MPRPVQRQAPMLELLARAWARYPDQRLGQLIGNAARHPDRPFDYRDPFNVEDDVLWLGLERLAAGPYDPGPFGGPDPLAEGDPPPMPDNPS